MLRLPFGRFEHLYAPIAEAEMAKAMHRSQNSSPLWLQPASSVKGRADVKVLRVCQEVGGAPLRAQARENKVSDF